MCNKVSYICYPSHTLNPHPPPELVDISAKYDAATDENQHNLDEMKNLVNICRHLRE